MRQSLETVKKATSAKDGGNKPVLFPASGRSACPHGKMKPKVCFHSGVNELAVFLTFAQVLATQLQEFTWAKLGRSRMEYNPQQLRSVTLSAPCPRSGATSDVLSNMPHVHGQTKLKKNKILGFPYYILPLSQNIIPVGHVPFTQTHKKDFSTEIAVVGERQGKIYATLIQRIKRREGDQQQQSCWLTHLCIIHPLLCLMFSMTEVEQQRKIGISVKEIRHPQISFYLQPFSVLYLTGYMWTKPQKGSRTGLHPSENNV